MRTRKTSRGFCALGATCALTLGMMTIMPVMAATVTWTSKENMVADGTDLNNSGTILAAVNFSPSASAATINGIDFSVCNSLTGSGTYWALNLNTGRAGWDADPGRVNYEGQTFYPNAGGFALYPLINEVIYLYTDGSEHQQLVLNNLVLGHQYLLQVVFEQAGGRGGVLTDVTGGGNSPSVSYGGSKGAAMITASWTAGSTTQTFEEAIPDGHAGAWAGFVLSDITPAAPSAPTITGIVPGDGTLNVAFTAPSSNGGATITDYKYSTDNGENWTSAGQTSSPILISELANDTEYLVKIRAVNSVGDGTPSAAVAGTPTSGTTAPLAPTITGITPGNTTLSVAFTAPISDGGELITNYEYSTDDGSTYTAVSPASTSSPILISGLVNGTAYPVVIRAVNSVGVGLPSADVTGTPATTPSVPTITGITPGNLTLSVVFTAPTLNGGATISNYKVSTDGGTTFILRESGTTASPILISGLTAGTEYTVKILAVNSAGDGTPSDSMTGTPFTTASAPTITSVTPGNGTLSIAFTPPVSDGYAAISNYKVSVDNGANYTAVSPATTASPILVGGLTAGTSYTVKIRAVNAAGDGDQSNGESGTPTAAAITWTTKTNMAQDGSDLFNTDTILAAINFTSKPAGAYTLNGVPFTIQSDVTGSGTYYQVTTTGGSTGLDSDRLQSQAHYPTVPSAFPLGYLIDDYKYFFTDGGQVHSFVMRNLTVGGKYRFQMVFYRADQRTDHLSSGGSVSPDVNYGGSSGAAIISAEWTATSDTQSFRPYLHGGCVAGFVLSENKPKGTIISIF